MLYIVFTLYDWMNERYKVDGGQCKYGNLNLFIYIWLIKYFMVNINTIQFFVKLFQLRSFATTFQFD